MIGRGDVKRGREGDGKKDGKYKREGGALECMRRTTTVGPSPAVRIQIVNREWTKSAGKMCASKVMGF